MYCCYLIIFIIFVNIKLLYYLLIYSLFCAFTSKRNTYSLYLLPIQSGKYINLSWFDGISSPINLTVSKIPHIL